MRVNAAELMRVSGQTRHVGPDVAPSEVELDDERLTPGEPIVVDLLLESVNDGVVVTGRIGAPWHGVCRRCLEPLTGVAEASVEERYQRSVTDPEAFPIEHDQIDLAPLVRETVLLELPQAPLCRPDCAGLCDVCGVNRNVETCTCTTTVSDARWSALDPLRKSLSE